MKVLIVEDDRRLAATLSRGLRNEGWAVDAVHDGTEALIRLGASDYDVVILDRDLPGVSGDSVCAALRAQGHPVRILMLTAAGTLDDRVAGLDLGADAYLPKPFAYLELLAHLRALGRRAPSAGAIVAVGSLRLDAARRTAEQAGMPLSLTPKELAVLDVLLTAQGGWVSVDELLDEVWHETVEPDRAVVKATVFKLRRKLVDPRAIESGAAFGYRVVVAPEASS
ncbi:MAG: response regulator transcription factor [Promicromonosporaceae bacterium]|nr:response regulator transcription factor [Promicromonosporaceae bacterium]